MRTSSLTVIAAAAAATFIAGASAMLAQPRPAPPTVPLFPLSERDLAATSESGCECSFDTGRRRAALLRAIGHELTIRTARGRQVCRITDAQFSAVSGDRASVNCAGLSLSTRRTGRVRSDMHSDSATWPASLTVTQGRARRTIAGTMGCAC